MKAIFSCLNLKPDDGFLAYIMPELFNKTGQGVTDIVIAWDEVKPVLHPEYFFTYTYCVLEWNEGPPPWLGPVSKKFFKSLE